MRGCIIFLLLIIAHLVSFSQELGEIPFKKCNTIVYTASENELERIDEVLFNMNIQIDKYDDKRMIIETDFSNNFDDNASLVYTAFYFRIHKGTVYLTGEYYSGALGVDIKESIYYSGWAVPKSAFKRMELIASKLSDSLKYSKK
ncbi:MAG: hypothetical protein RLO17_02125 [Cyclobacteriaceae bacterium]